MTPGLMRVSKRFRWEGAHRLPSHAGLCRNLHGHSYRMSVEVEGPVGDDGMVLDFKDLKALVKPLVDAWDHATMVSDDDTDLQEVFATRDWKAFRLPYPSTAENIARFAADFVCHRGADVLTACGVTRIVVRVEETDTCEAVYERAIGGDPVTDRAALDQLGTAVRG